MKKFKDIVYVAIVVIAAAVVVGVVWLVASRYFALTAQVNQNTQNIQSIVQYIDQHTQAPSAASSSQ